MSARLPLCVCGVEAGPGPAAALREFDGTCLQHAVKKLLVAGGRGGGKDIKSLGWALLSTLQAEGVRFSGRAIVEEALDWDATLLMQRYCEASKEARQMGRKIANHVVFTATGIDRDATTAAKPAKAA